MQLTEQEYADYIQRRGWPGSGSCLWWRPSRPCWAMRPEPRHEAPGVGVSAADRGLAQRAAQLGC